MDEQEVLDKPQVQHNEIVEAIQDPNFGTVLRARPPAVFSATPARMQGRSPLHGEHGAEVLLELGYGSDNITRHAKGGLIATGGGLKSK